MLLKNKETTQQYYMYILYVLMERSAEEWFKSQE